MVWPEMIDVAIDPVQSAAFLTEDRKCDILYNNAPASSDYVRRRSTAITAADWTRVS